RIKLFYRPTAIIPEKPGMIWQDQLVFKKQGNQFIAENPTPYYITIIGLSNKLNGEDSDKLTTFPGLMVAPKSSLEIPVKTN
ncbi:molecular chaperone, partial [Escherichia coli]|nr:molecular chaperone [Escherichia coli]